jgi:hypothetical protein
MQRSSRFILAHKGGILNTRAKKDKKQVAHAALASDIALRGCNMVQPNAG